ncbi:MAG: NmrA family NAD(P)-binding protein, partial [Proteobacteria bacterium]|nr:NmrA family NAD(P)-binding protein [Pseudomonadota bacterium]
MSDTRTGPGFPNLFSPLRIGGITLKNRIVSTGHETAMADENGINETIVAYHEARAKGGAGLIIVEVALVHDAAVFTVNPIKVTSDDCIPRYRRLAEVVQRHDCRLFGQLFHPGREIIDSLDGSAPVSFAPSAVPNERFHVMPKPMSRDDIARVVAGFGDGARRLREAGLDGAEMLASHGYLLSQFLNPRVNLRDDEYGGDLQGRLRIFRDIIADIRAKAGVDFTLGMRISGDERSHEGLNGAEVVEADLHDPQSLNRAFAGAHGAYCVTFFWEHFSPDKEGVHAHAMAQAAKEAGLAHVIWSTFADTRKLVPLDDDRMPTLMKKYKVPHFDTTGEANHLFTDLGVPTTFLNTSFYWDNMIYFGMGPQRSPDGTLAITFPMGDKKLPSIAAEDI